MNIEIQARNIALTRALHQFIRKRIRFGFDRFAESIKSIQIRLTDLNGAKGGANDKQCQFLIRIPHQPDVVVKSTAAKLEVAINKATARTAIAVSRQIKKRKRAQLLPRVLAPVA